MTNPFAGYRCGENPYRAWVLSLLIVAQGWAFLFAVKRGRADERNGRVAVHAVEAASWGEQPLLLPFPRGVEANPIFPLPRELAGRRMWRAVDSEIGAGLRQFIGPKIIRLGQSSPVRLPGEFERQDALMIAGGEFVDELPELFVSIVSEVHQNVQVLVITSNHQEYQDASRLFLVNGIPLDRIRFLEVEHDTMWARDYGPMVVKPEDGPSKIVDPGYDPIRPRDDQMPLALGRRLQLPVTRAAARIDGGNLLSNGKGLAITTHRLVEENAAAGIDERRLSDILHRCYGFRQIVVLEPLEGEPTGHVDMFATFTSSDTVVLGAYDPRHDPQNAARLDRNARILSQVKTATDRLRVVRVPMPPHHDGVWRTYTNVVFANGVFLTPVYPGQDAAGRRQALQTYARLMPNRRVVGVDAAKVIESEGALHCVTVNLGPIGPLPLSPRSHSEPASAAVRPPRVKRLANTR